MMTESGSGSGSCIRPVPEYTVDTSPLSASSATVPEN